MDAQLWVPYKFQQATMNFLHSFTLILVRKVTRQVHIKQTSFFKQVDVIHKLRKERKYFSRKNINRSTNRQKFLPQSENIVKRSSFANIHFWHIMKLTRYESKLHKLNNSFKCNCIQTNNNKIKFDWNKNRVFFSNILIAFSFSY